MSTGDLIKCPECQYFFIFFKHVLNKCPKCEKKHKKINGTFIMKIKNFLINRQ